MPKPCCTCPLTARDRIGGSYAKTAKGRAVVAARLLLNYRKRDFYDCGCWDRAFDDCFEMGDGHRVYSLLVSMAADDPELRQAARSHGYAELADKAERQASMLAPLFEGLEVANG